MLNIKIHEKSLQKELKYLCRNNPTWRF